jgi:hypothetical protein
MGASRGKPLYAVAGSPSSNRRPVRSFGFAVLLLAALVVPIASALASKQVIDYFGNGPGSLGGQFNNPRDVAVNATGAGGVPAGTIYVADDLNHRVQRFNPDGSFVSAWGANVLTEGVNEVQTITVNATAGSYTLSFGGATTAPLAYNAEAAAVQTALQGLPTIGSGNVTVSGTSPYVVSFTAALSVTNVAQLSVDDSLLTGSVAIATTTQGSGAYEVCAVAASCRAGVATGGANVANTAKNGSLDNPQSVAVDSDTGNVYVSDRDNRRINEYAADGTFIRSFGWGVDASTAGNEYEVCPASDRCTFGIAGSGAGQVGSIGTAGTLGIAVSQPNGEAAVGKVFLADTQNRRVNTYGVDGTSPSSFGSSGNFGTTQPRKIAVDSRGVVYASDSNSSAQIDRYDSENANGGGVGFLASIAAPPLLAGPVATATSGLAVDPDSDGAGADEDVLYVLRDPTSGNTVVQQYGPINDPGLSAAPTSVDDTHGGEAGFGVVQGLGLSGATGKLYVSATTNVAGLGNGHRVYVLDNITAPAATLDPITEFDAHSATFSGEVNPNGSRTGYRFEYVDDAEFQVNGFTNAARFPLLDVDLGAGTASVPVEVEIPHNLAPSTTYHVRLVAKHVFTTTETIGGPLTFTTPGAAPSFHTAATPGEEEATLRAAINPEGQEVTNYHFEWGPSESYGNSTPAKTLPTGAEPVAVEELLSGLVSGQTYHYRLLATNGSGTTSGPDGTFTTIAPPLFPKRGYELVSPYPTGGIPVTPGFATVHTSEDGNVVNIGNEQPFPGSELVAPPDHYHNGSLTQYVSTRGVNGWHVEETGWAASAGGGGWSQDGSRYLFMTAYEASFDDRLDPDDQNSTIGTDVYQRQPDGSVAWVSRDPRLPVGTPQTAPQRAEHAFTGSLAYSGDMMSVDGKSAVFKSLRQLSDDDTTASSTVFRLYKWQEGQLSFIGKRPDGSVPGNGTNLGSIGPPSSDGNNQGVVSRNGDRVIFSAQRHEEGQGPEKNTLYIQTDGQPTVEAVKETGVPPLPAPQPYKVTYRGAAADLSRAFFTSNSRLTPDSGASGQGTGDPDLYVYDIAADEVRDLTPRLDGIEDPAVDPATDDSGRPRGLVANSEDGRRVYFVADAQYDVAPNPEGQLPSAAGRNLYLAELDSIDDPISLRFIASLGVGDSSVWRTRLISGDGKAAYASPDGSVLGFGSGEPLTGQALGGTTQLFVYDAEAETLECASCPGDGSVPNASVNLRSLAGQSEDDQYWQGGSALKRWVSSSGQVFFHTSIALTPDDEDDAPDVYEYLAGQLKLLSSGTGTTASRFESASRDGNTVVFNTLDALIPLDKEPGVPKLYAARVNGGFPYVPLPPPCDLAGGACEGPGTQPPNQPGAGTPWFVGPENPPLGKRPKPCPKGKHKVRRKGKIRCVLNKKGKRHANHDRRVGR